LLGTVLTVIDDHAGDGVCFLKIQTIADEAKKCSGAPTRQVKRAVKALRRLGLIKVWRQRTPRGTTCNHFRIIWERVEEFAVDPRHSVLELPFADDDQSATADPTKVPCEPDQSATEAPTKVPCVAPTKVPYMAPHEAPQGSAPIGSAQGSAQGSADQIPPP